MTKKEIITKWGNIIAASWAMQEKFELFGFFGCEQFVTECKANGYEPCIAQLWQKALTFAERAKVDSDTTRLKLLRMSKGLSQSQLSSLSGIPVRTIQMYEQGERKIAKASFDTVSAISQALGVTPEEIM